MQNTEVALIIDNTTHIYNMIIYMQKSAVIVVIGPTRNSREVVTIKRFMTIHYQIIAVIIIIVNGQHI